MALDREQPDQDDKRDGYNIRFQRGCHDVETLDRGEHRNRGRDHPVAVEHRRAENAQTHQPPSRAALAQAARNQRGQRHDAALAVIVCAHDQCDVLERHDDHDRPEDHRQDAVDVRLGQREPMRSGEALAQRIERAGPDVAKDDADGSDDQRCQRLASGANRVGAVAGGVRRQHAPSSERREKRMLSCFSFR